jgi:hypothetical protein
VAELFNRAFSDPPPDIVDLINAKLSARWSEAFVAVLCAPPIIAGAVALAAAQGAAEHFVLLLVMSPILVAAGAIAVILASVASLWLPGRRYVKLALIGAGCLGWIVGFVLLMQPGLIELP